MADLKSFLMQLSKDASLRDRFRQDPDAVMEEQGIGESDQEAVRSGDPERIRTAIGADDSAFIVIIAYK